MNETFQPTGSITPELIYLSHQVTGILWTNEDVITVRAVKSCLKTNTSKRPIHPCVTVSYVEHLCCYLWQTLFKGVCHLM